MTKRTKKRISSSPAEDKSNWREQSEKQKILLTSILSLLNKYGNSMDVDSLHREFLLTLMGQYLVTDACFFTEGDRSHDLIPTALYGRMETIDLHPVGVGSSLVEHLDVGRSPQTLDALPKALVTDAVFGQLKGMAAVIAPLYLKNKLVGLVVLGEKVTRAPFTPFDLELLNTLCSVSSIAFNNAKIFENVRSSMHEVERLAELREEMISRISHEFRTPLTGIKTGLACLPQADETKTIHDVISGSVDRLHELIDSLLLLNQKYRAADETDECVSDPTAAVYEVISTCQQEASSKNLRFDVREHIGDQSCKLRISKDNFLIVAEQLIKNAIKFSSSDSTIAIEFEVVSRDPCEDLDGHFMVDWRDQARKTVHEYSDLVGARRAPAQGPRPPDNTLSPPEQEANISHFVLRIADSGIGIPEDELSFIGEPFRQASNSPEQRVRGKALGLAVVQTLLSHCDGRLCCRSEVGVGTTFSVFIPFAV